MRIVFDHLFRIRPNWAWSRLRRPFMLRRAVMMRPNLIPKLLLAMFLFSMCVNSAEAQIHFPISASQDDHFPGSGGYMHTDVIISRNGDGSGQLSALTHTWEVTDLRGFRGSVAVVVLDENKKLLWVSTTQNYGVDGRWVGTSDRKENWADTIPAQQLSQARYVAIKQRWNPKPVADDIGGWLRGIGDVGAELGAILQGLQVKYYYPLVAFSENFVAAFVTELDKVVPIKNRNIFIIGGSTGGALALRMGHRPEPWIKKIVAWNPASVWTSYAADDVQKGFVLSTGFGRSVEPERPPLLGECPAGWETAVLVPCILPSSREDYFIQTFGMPRPFGTPWPETQPNPEEWYRGNRGDYAANRDTKQPFRDVWQCKWDYIAASRLEAQEVYNPAYRRWHWRLGTELLVFSFLNDSWTGPANSASGNPQDPPAIYDTIRKPTLLVAADDDDWNEGETLGAERHWEDRWDRTTEMAPKMRNTPGYTLWLPNTGHSIHNERPNLFAEQIVTFLVGNIPNTGPLQVRPALQEPSSDESCQLQLPQFPPIPGELLDHPESASFLLERANLHGNFSDGNGPGHYSLRLNGNLRYAAQRRSPLFALGRAAARYYSGDTVWGNAFADVAVTGAGIYDEFRKHQSTDDEVAAEARTVLTQMLPFVIPVDELKLRNGVRAAQTRAYKVAWALRNPNAQQRYQFRRTLGWIAVSGEDDPPDRPVNVPSGIPIFEPHGKTQVSAFPQYDLPVTMCPSFRVRYSIASAQSGPVAPPEPSVPYRLGVLPGDPTPTIPTGDDIILYIHGGPGSRLEEASDLIKPLHDAGLAKGKRYTVISFDQPSQGYSSMVDPTSIVSPVDKF